MPWCDSPSVQVTEGVSVAVHTVHIGATSGASVAVQLGW